MEELMLDVEGQAPNGELRQFIAGQLSMHTSHVKNLLLEMELRIVDSFAGAVKESKAYPAQASMLRHSASSGAIMDTMQKASVSRAIGSNRVSTPFACEVAWQTKNQTQTEGKAKDGLAAAMSNLPGAVSFDPVHDLDDREVIEMDSQVIETASLEDSLNGSDFGIVGVSTNKKGKIFSVEDEIKQLSQNRQPKSKLVKSLSTTWARATTATFDSAKTCHARLASFVSSRPVELAICILILANALVIGAQVDDQMKNPKPDGRRTVFRVFDIFFTVVFTIELVLRLAAESRTFCSPRHDNFKWNVFDSGLVVLSIAEEIINAAMDSSPHASMLMLRVFRLLRLVRLFRIVRVMRFFRDLRVMVSGIVRSLQSLVWALLLMVCVMYLAAMCVMQFAAEEGEERAKDGATGNLSEAEYAALQEYFGSLFKTMYTLYVSITGGLDWKDAADPLFSLGWVVGTFYTAYIAFSVLCVLNIVTGVFVENCNKHSEKDEELVYMEQLETRRQWYGEVQELFQSFDNSRSGFLNAQEFASKVQDDVRLRAWLRKIGVHIESYSAGSLFQLLDLDGDGQLDFDEFATSLQQLHGHARSIDVAKIIHNTNMLRKLLAAVVEKVAPELTSRRSLHILGHN